MTDTTAIPATRCEGVTGHRLVDWGEVTITCGQSVGLTRWQDSSGHEHAACIRHVAERRHRYPAVTESEARGMWGDR